jgi:DnaK suppressor protein
MSALTKSQIQQLQRALRQRRDILIAELQAGVKSLREESAAAVDAGVPDSGDLSAADLSTAVYTGEIARDASELHEVESALHRLASPEFGSCADCGEPIGWLRLSATPTARRCIACQERHERRYADQATGSL